jgi:glycosyltransferase involved in cell wall biosynthesis
MRILQVITSLKTGGAENLVSELVPLMNDENYQTDVLIFDGSDAPFKKKLENGGYQVITIGNSKNVYDIKLIFRLIPIIKKYDIVHTHNSACQLFVALAKAISGAKCRLVTTEHNTDNRRRHIFGFKMIDRWMYHQYDAIIAISNKAAELLEKYIGTGFYIRTIVNGVNVEKYKDAEPIAKLRNGNDVIITMVAAFRPQKDQDTLISAMKKLPKNYKLWLVGDGERRKICENLVAELNIKDRVTFWGIRTDIPQVLKTSDIIVMSTHYEGMSLSNIEGMSAEKPFVASDVNGIHEITSGAGVLFREGDSEQLAKEIQHLMTDADYYKMIADRCMKRAEEFDISKTAEGYRRVYEELKKK